VNTFDVRSNIKNYIEWKRKDGVWGDHIEIQGLIEIYSRGLEIYGYSMTPIRTFSKSKHPMRI
jgi:OTU domain-containing protein 5